MSITPRVFIDEFHAMLAMYMNSVSILYGSPACAFEMTMCISPCADIGLSQVNALSMRAAVPSGFSARSSGPWTKPSAGRPAGRCRWFCNGVSDGPLPVWDRVV